MKSNGGNLGAICVWWVSLAALLLLMWKSSADLRHLLQPAVAASLTVLAIIVNRLLLGLPTFSFSSLVLIVYASFHLAGLLPVQFGLCQSRESDLAAESYLRGLNAYMLFVCGAQIGTIFGFSTWGRRRLMVSSTVETDHGGRDEWLWQTGIAFLTISAALLVFGLGRVGFGVIWGSQYTDLYSILAQSDPRFIGIGTWGIRCAVLFLLAAAGSRRRRLASYGLCAGVVTYSLLMGSRGAAFTLMLVAAAVTVRRGLTKRTSLLWALVVCFVLIAAPVVRQMRKLTVMDRLAVDLIDPIDIACEGPLEIGGTFKMLAQSTALIPDLYPHWSGRSYLTALKSLAPNLRVGWEGVQDKTAEFNRLGSWLTFVLEPSTFISHGGLGSSGIAEPYVNFGPAAIPLHFFCLFYCLSWLDFKSNHGQSSWRLALGAAIVMSVAWSARDDVFSYLRNSVWCAGILWAGYNMFDAKPRKRSHLQ